MTWFANRQEAHKAAKARGVKRWHVRFWCGPWSSLGWYVGDALPGRLVQRMQAGRAEVVR